MPEGLLFRPVDLDLRKHILQNYTVTSIISLPKGVFRPYAKQNKTDIIILEKKQRTESVWFYDLTQDGFDLDSDLRPEIDQNDIPELLNKWSDKADGHKSWSVDIEKIKEKNYDLMAKTYKPTVQYTSKYELKPFSDIMTENKNAFTIHDKTEYQRITIKLHGKGLFQETEYLEKR